MQSLVPGRIHRIRQPPTIYCANALMWVVRYHSLYTQSTYWVERTPTRHLRLSSNSHSLRDRVRRSIRAVKGPHIFADSTGYERVCHSLFYNRTHMRTVISDSTRGSRKLHVTKEGSVYTIRQFWAQGDSRSPHNLLFRTPILSSNCGRILFPHKLRYVVPVQSLCKTRDFIFPDHTYYPGLGIEGK